MVFVNSPADASTSASVSQPFRTFPNPSASTTYPHGPITHQYASTLHTVPSGGFESNGSIGADADADADAPPSSTSPRTPLGPGSSSAAGLGPLVEPQQDLNDFLESFWTRQMDFVERDNPDFKTYPLPLARIKKVMKSDEVVNMISAEAPIMFSKACELFIAELTCRAWLIAEAHKRRTLQKSDVAAAIALSDMFDFLIDIVPRDEGPGGGGGGGGGGGTAEAGEGDGAGDVDVDASHAEQGVEGSANGDGDADVEGSGMGGVEYAEHGEREGEEVQDDFGQYVNER